MRYTRFPLHNTQVPHMVEGDTHDDIRRSVRKLEGVRSSLQEAETQSDRPVVGKPHIQ